MKFQPILFIAALSAATFFSSCQNDGDASKSTAADGTGVQSAPPGAQPATPDASTGTAPMPLADPTAAPTVAPAPPTTAPPTEPPQNAAGVWHYTCPKGCKGGGGAATACAKCGTTLTHNTAYHAQPTTAPSGTTSAPSTTPQKTPEPAQNAAGVWHYTCPGGCKGGGGTAAPCGKCGKTLAHNSAYHQK